jgi:Ras GTPase-activating-like protein IQGAP2/3
VYLRTTLPGVLKTVQDDRNLDLELNPIMIHQTLVPGSNVTEDQALDNPEVKKQLEKRIKDLENICQQFFDTVFSTMDKLPYGLRWICKMMRTLCEKQLPDASKDDLLRLTGYFVYYRFINVALVSPEAFKIVTRELGTKERKNLIVVGKVLQKAFNLKNFGKAEKTLMPMNGFIERVHSNLVKYFNDLVQVADPEDYLQVDQYNEITRKEKPVIVISLTEMISIHRLIYEKLDSLASADDPLRAVMKDLGAPPTDFNDADNREIQLTLQSRFKKEVKEEEQNLVTYAETKELCIPILRAVPLGSSMSELTLPDVLETGAEYAKQSGNKLLAEQVATVSKNLQILEAAGLVNPKDDYAQLVHDIAIEVANRASIRERQKKEIARLTVTLQKLKKNTAFTSEQVWACPPVAYLTDPRLFSLVDCGVREVSLRCSQEAVRGQEPAAAGEAQEVRLRQAGADGRDSRVRAGSRCEEARQVRLQRSRGWCLRGCRQVRQGWRGAEDDHQTG